MDTNSIQTAAVVQASRAVIVCFPASAAESDIYFWFRLSLYFGLLSWILLLIGLGLTPACRSGYDSVKPLCYDCLVCIAELHY